MKLVIFGAGRVGSSMDAYARSLGHDVFVAMRTTPRTEIEAAIGAASLVAAAIPDDRLGAWREEWRAATGARPAIHFSGALHFPGFPSYHPLYSFPRTSLPPAITAAIAIARDAGSPPFSALLSGAANPEFEVEAADRAFYHALAVISGNLAAHAWNEAAAAFARRFPEAPPNALPAYFRSVVDRFEESPFNSLTGPVARRDRKTVEANLAALGGHAALTRLYRAFLTNAWPEAAPLEKPPS